MYVVRLTGSVFTKFFKILLKGFEDSYFIDVLEGASVPYHVREVYKLLRTLINPIHNLVRLTNIYTSSNELLTYPQQLISDVRVFLNSSYELINQ